MYLLDIYKVTELYIFVNHPLELQMHYPNPAIRMSLRVKLYATENSQELSINIGSVPTFVPLGLNEKGRFFITGMPHAAHTVMHTNKIDRIYTFFFILSPIFEKKKFTPF